MDPRAMLLPGQEYVMVPAPKLVRVEYKVSCSINLMSPLHGEIWRRAHRKMEEFSRRFAIHNAAFPFIKRILITADENEFRLCFLNLLTDRDNHQRPSSGHPIDVRFNNSWNVFFVSESDQVRLARLMREALFEAIRHEMDESIYIEGERVYDPHKDEKR